MCDTQKKLQFKQRNIKNRESMKRMILVILMVAVTVQISSAQSEQSKQKRKSNHEMTAQNGQHRRDSKQVLAKELGLTDEQAEVFAPIYAEYRKAIRGEKPEQHKKFDFKEADDVQTLTHLNDWLDKDIRTATIRKEYIDKFMTVLTPKQVAKLYRMESSFGRSNQRAPQHRPQPHGEHGRRPEMGGHGAGGHRPM